jgi:hypothetical protein
MDKKANTQYFLDLGTSKRFINIVPKEEFESLSKQILMLHFCSMFDETARKKVLGDMTKIAKTGYYKKGGPGDKFDCVRYAKTFYLNDPSQTHVEITDRGMMGFKILEHFVEPN